jgi:hypothetical protein
VPTKCCSLLASCTLILRVLCRVLVKRTQEWVQITILRILWFVIGNAHFWWYNWVQWEQSTVPVKCRDPWTALPSPVRSRRWQCPMADHYTKCCAPRFKPYCLHGFLRTMENHLAYGGAQELSGDTWTLSVGARLLRTWNLLLFWMSEPSSSSESIF